MPQPNPAALTFLANRRSRPAKLFALPVPTAEALTDILTIASRVPDHGKLEPWRFVVIAQDAFARLATLAADHARSLGADPDQIAKGRGQYDLGLLAVVVIASPKPSEKVPVSEQTLSAGALCMNIVTTAEAAGWGACWLTGWPAHDAVFTAAAFGTAAHETVAGIIHIGTPAPTDAPDRPRPDVPRLVQWLRA
jgi:nitroreductase